MIHGVLTLLIRKRVLGTLLRFHGTVKYLKFVYIFTVSIPLQMLASNEHHY